MATGLATDAKIISIHQKHKSSPHPFTPPPSNQLSTTAPSICRAKGKQGKFFFLCPSSTSVSILRSNHCTVAFVNPALLKLTLLALYRNFAQAISLWIVLCLQSIL